MPEPQGLSQPRQIIGHFATHRGDFGCKLPPSKPKTEQEARLADALCEQNDRIAALEAELAAANARIAELEEAEERAFKAGYYAGFDYGGYGHSDVHAGVCWLEYKGGGES